MNELIFHKLVFINESLKRRNANEKSISRGQGRILAILHQKDGISTKDLSEILNINVTSLNETLNKLMRNGYIKKESSPIDKRVLLIYLTDKGREFRFQKPKDIDIFNCLSDSQKEEFNNCLDLISRELHSRQRREDPEKFEKMLQHRKKVFEKVFGDEIDLKEWFRLLNDK